GIYLRWIHMMHPVDLKKSSTSVRTIRFDDGRLKIEDVVAISEGPASYPRLTIHGSLSSLKPTNFECRRWPSGVHLANSICATNSGLSHWQFLISSFVSAHIVRFFSG